MSSHLSKANQTYFQHFRDSIVYCGMSLQASLFFLIHSFIPDYCETRGSNMINKIHNIIKNKYRERQ